MTTGERLKFARTQRKISQQRLADAIGTSRTVITNIEGDKNKINRSTSIDSICRVLKINKAWLLDGEGPMDNPLPDWNTDEVLYKIHEDLIKFNHSQLLYVYDFIERYGAYHTSLPNSSEDKPLDQ